MISGLKPYERDVVLFVMRKLRGVGEHDLVFAQENLDDFIHVVVDEMDRRLPVTPGAVRYIGKMIEQRLK